MLQMVTFSHVEASKLFNIIRINIQFSIRFVSQLFYLHLISLLLISISNWLIMLIYSTVEYK